tara:strand:- start:736 stop:1032 length:297 start_codon:yes stop_codon:yes gene_type:complete
MGFIQKINARKFTLISLLLFLYVALNLIDGERGLISFLKKQNIKNNLIQEQSKLTKELSLIEMKNKLLTDKIDKDYLEILYRKRFMVGKKNEIIFKNN